ncbi:CpsD/CapB family tyrosine-protein kinase [Rubrobacter indicoceani]|uniref:CpsD/CapB family tyrosine-protein kinase n=1 Tax=Rubrobacter indicoceani TaxID=2051957 RepID=UPI0013C44964|nr:CpsD/CapB family tyrosine-protein kinase [Rubrobacter indicoceani]
MERRISRSPETELLLGKDSPVKNYYEDLAINLIALGEIGTVVVTSPETGAGCTSVCLGLAGAFVGLERRVAVVDCNLREPKLHAVLGEPNFVGLTSGLSGERPLSDYGREVAPGLLVVTTGPVSPSSVTVARRRVFVEAVKGLERDRDIVILDAPVVAETVATPGLARGFGGILLVVHAQKTSKKAAREAANTLHHAGAEVLGVVLNGCP